MVVSGGFNFGWWWWLSFSGWVDFGLGGGWLRKRQRQRGRGTRSKKKREKRDWRGERNWLVLYLFYWIVCKNKK